MNHEHKSLKRAYMRIFYMLQWKWCEIELL